MNKTLYSSQSNLLHFQNTNTMSSSKVAKLPSAAEAANQAALAKLKELAKSNAGHSGAMRFNRDVTFWQVMDPEVEDGMLQLCRHIYVQVPKDKVKSFERINPCAIRMKGSTRERLESFCAENNLPPPESGAGDVLKEGYVEYQVLRFMSFDVSPSLLNKDGNCSLEQLTTNAIVAVGFEQETVFVDGEQKTELRRRIVAIVPEECYNAFEIPIQMDQRDDTDDRGDMAYFE